MSQIRLFEFESNDSTYNLNTRFLVSEEIGVQGGFDFSPSADLNLSYNHNQSGVLFTNVDLSQTKKGVIITKQGVCIFEDTILSLPISVVGNVGRRDAIILTHTYEYQTNGSVGLYSVIENIGANEPILPSNKILIGILELPANCTALNQAGVNYIRKDADKYVKTNEKGKVNGIATLDQDGKVPFLQLPESFNKTTIVPTIADRNNLINNYEGRKVHVTNATADASVSTGSAGYIWNGASWEKIYESESLDLNLSNYYTQSQVNSLVNNATPLGMIIQTDEIVSMFDATGLGLANQKWKGWAICNGQNNTPDLRGRVVVQYDDRNLANIPDFSDVFYNTMLAVNGQKSVKLTAGQIPKHNHKSKKRPNFFSIEYEFDRLLCYSSNGLYNEGLSAGVAATTGGSVDATQILQEPVIIDSAVISDFGNDEAHENRMPFMVLAFIKKISY